MIRRFQLSNILVTLCLLTAITSAWPWPPSLEDFGVEGLLVRRQDNTKSGKQLPTHIQTLIGRSHWSV